MEDYKSNSHKYREEQKQKALEEHKVQKVVRGVAKTKKKSGVAKLADVFISEDIYNVKDYLIQDVLVPTAKKAILGAMDMVLNGGSVSSRRTSSDKVSYRKYYDDRRDDDRRPTGVRKRFDFDDIVFETRGEAEAVLDQMYDTIKEYGFVTVAAMYDMADLTQPFTSNKYGWTSLRTAEVVRDSDGYTIKLPKAMPID